MKTIRLRGYQDFNLVCYLWDKVDKPKGVVQIIHGMQEHSKRYNSFAKYLNEQGLIVFASDLRGHGQTALENNLPLGYSDGDIFDEIVKDQIIITKYLKDKFKLHVSIFGHSFGSFISQKLIIENGFLFKNIILSGTTYTNSFQFKLGHKVAFLCNIFRGKKKQARLIEKMSLRKYGKYFENGNWLSRDEKVWTEYNNDSLCGKPFPNNFYYSLFKNARKNYKCLENIPFYLPIFIISGTDDPVAGKKDIIKLFYTYGKSGKKIFIKFYLNSRHELINDFEKDVVYSDVSKFILNDSIDNLHYI